MSSPRRCKYLNFFQFRRVHLIGIEGPKTSTLLGHIGCRHPVGVTMCPSTSVLKNVPPFKMARFVNSLFKNFLDIHQVPFFFIPKKRSRFFSFQLCPIFYRFPAALLTFLSYFDYLWSLRVVCYSHTYIHSIHSIAYMA